MSHNTPSNNSQDGRTSATPTPTPTTTTTTFLTKTITMTRIRGENNGDYVCTVHTLLRPNKFCVLNIK
jgi:hypothetical protein